MSSELIYQDVLLAAASYVNWNTDSASAINDDLKLNLGFTDAQITEFRNLYLDAAGNPDYIFRDDDSGFVAVVFRNQLTQKITVSFRGTDAPKKGDRFIFDIGMTRRDKDAKAGKNNITAYAASCRAARA